MIVNKSKILSEITETRDDNRLLEIFENNDDFEIRYAIVNLINEDSILYEIFSNEKPTSLPNDMPTLATSREWVRRL